MVAAPEYPYRIQHNQGARQIAHKHGEKPVHDVLRIALQKERDVMQQGICNQMRERRYEQSLRREIRQRFFQAVALKCKTIDS